MSKYNLIIIARNEEEQDLLFQKAAIRQHSLLYQKAVVMLFSVVSQFFDFIEGMHDDYSFILLVHPGLRATTQGQDGLIITNELLANKNYTNLQFDYTSRNTDPTTFKGRTVHHMNFVADEDFDLGKLPLNNMGKLRGKTAPSEVSGKNSNMMIPVTLEAGDFAILTALHDSEYRVWEDDCTCSTSDRVYNSRTAKFKDQWPALRDHPDYDRSFHIIHQERMGLVDGAVHATQIMSHFEPTFLLMSGVCGGNASKGINLYDVIIPTIVHDYATGRFKASELESLEYESIAHRGLINFLKNHIGDIVLNMKAMIPHSRKHILPDNFKIVVDEFACGPWVVKTAGFIDKMGFDFSDPNAKKQANFDSLPVKNISKNIVGLEMESYSILRASEIIQRDKQYALVVKSVMDFTNEFKTDGAGGEIKANASYISYLCCRAMMPFLLEFKGQQKAWK